MKHYQCELLDEFSERGGPCKEHSSCLPTAPGEWKCICDLGYYANNEGDDSDHSPDCRDIDECADGTFGEDGPYRSDVDRTGIHRKIVTWPFPVLYNLGISDDRRELEDTFLDKLWRGQAGKPVGALDVGLDADSPFMKSGGKNLCIDGNSHCENTEGSYNCICNIGWEGDARKKCVNVNECQRNLHLCNIPPSF